MGETKEHLIKEDAGRISTIEHSETVSEPIWTKNLSVDIESQTFFRPQKRVRNTVEPPELATEDGETLKTDKSLEL